MGRMRAGYRTTLLILGICALVPIGASLFSSKRAQARDDTAATPAVTGRDPVADLPPDLVSSWRLLAPALPHNLLGRRLRLTVHEAPLPELICHEEERPFPSAEAIEEATVDHPERLLCSLSTALLSKRLVQETDAENSHAYLLAAVLAHATVHAMDAVEARLTIVNRKAKNRRRLVGLFSWAALIAGAAAAVVTIGDNAAPWLLFYGQVPHHHSPPDHAAGSVASNLHRYGLAPDPYLAYRSTRRRQAVTRLVAIERIVDTKAAVLLKRAGIPITAQLQLYELLAHYRLTNLHRWPGFDRVAPNALLEAATARVPPSASQKR